MFTRSSPHAFALALLLAGCRASPGSAATTDAASADLPVLTGPITMEYAGELSDLCNLVSLGESAEKKSPETGADPAVFLAGQSTRARAPRTRALIARALALPPKSRGASVGEAYVREVLPLLDSAPLSTAADPSAPTAPWGVDPTPHRAEHARTCTLAVRFDGLADSPR